MVVVMILATSGCGGDSPSGPSPTRKTPPPFDGTIFIDPDIVTADDPTTFPGLVHVGQGSRTMLDRRVNGWITVDAVDSQVEAEFYATVIGRLSTSLREDVETVWIHRGVELFGG